MIRRRSHIVALSFSIVAGALVLAGCGSSSAKGDSATATRQSTKASNTKSTSVDASSKLRIEPGTGIAGVAIDDSRAQVISVLGKPTSERQVHNEQSGQDDTRLVYETPAVELILGPKVTQVETTDPTAETDSGVHVGSSTADVMAAFPTATCDTGDVVVCRVGKEAAGEVLTDFLLTKGEVTRIDVARLLD